MSKLFARCDAQMMRCIFHPVAWYVDARWHKNQFFLASVCIVLAMLVLGLQICINLLFMTGWIKLIVIPCISINLFLYQGWLNRFAAARKWQDDHPGKLCFPHHSFVLYPGDARFMQMTLSLFLFAALVSVAIKMRDLALACPGIWLMLIGCGMCFAGVLPPPPGARREKKVKALTWLTPAPLKS